MSSPCWTSKFAGCAVPLQGDELDHNYVRAGILENGKLSFLGASIQYHTANSALWSLDINMMHSSKSKHFTLNLPGRATPKNASQNPVCYIKI
eukprot:scaffold73105_cov49-Attheya_sp.AAC.3